jgi:hypothetical protein
MTNSLKNWKTIFFGKILFFYCFNQFIVRNISDCVLGEIKIF